MLLRSDTHCNLEVPIPVTTGLPEKTKCTYSQVWQTILLLIRNSHMGWCATIFLLTFHSVKKAQRSNNTAHFLINLFIKSGSGWLSDSKCENKSRLHINPVSCFHIQTNINLFMSVSCLRRQKKMYHIIRVGHLTTKDRNLSSSTDLTIKRILNAMTNLSSPIFVLHQNWLQSRD